VSRADPTGEDGGFFEERSSSPKVPVYPLELSEAEPVKEFETIRQPFFCASLSIVGLLIHATVGSFGGDGRRWRNRAGLAA
jgi:hypothetical protein